MMIIDTNFLLSEHLALYLVSGWTDGKALDYDLIRSTFVSLAKTIFSPEDLDRIAFGIDNFRTIVLSLEDLCQFVPDAVNL